MNLEQKLSHIDDLQKLLAGNALLQNESLEADFDLRYTHDSTAIEGNTLTLMETKVVLEGIAIGGKSLREHLEVVNHASAFKYVKDNLTKQFSETQIKSIHNLILRGIDDENAGKYRACSVRIGGSKHTPPPHCEIPNEMRQFIAWYKSQNLHPVIRACRVHIYFVGIHPFIDGNGRTARLLLNWELLRANLPAISIKSDCKAEYYQALEVAHCDKNESFFDNLIADYVLERLHEQKDFVDSANRV